MKCYTNADNIISITLYCEFYFRHKNIDRLIKINDSTINISDNNP